MGAVAQQLLGAFAAIQQEDEDRLVGLVGVAAAAGEDEVIPSIVGATAASWSDVIERDLVGVGAAAAVGADRSVTFQ